MEGAINISVFMALTAGLLSFASPCVLPIVPSFLGFISGMSFDQLASDNPQQKAPILLYTAWFVAGFSLIFIALGASATFIGGLLVQYQNALRVAGGIMVIILGLNFMGIFSVGLLQMEKRMHLKSKPAGVLGSFLIGITFALGWTPCIGPMLASILMMAASEGTVVKGMTMLAAYSAGFAIPFLLAALAIKTFMKSYRRFSKYMPKIMIASGAFLVLVGVLLVTNRFAYISELLVQ